MKRLGIVAFPGFQILDLAAAGVFEVANLLADRKTYDVVLLSERGGSVLSSSGITVDTQAFRDTLKKAGFYAEWKEKYGAEAWGLLEKSVGKLG